MWTRPFASPLAILTPLGENRATVVTATWPVYSALSAGLSMDRTKMDLPDCAAIGQQSSSESGDAMYKVCRGMFDGNEARTQLRLTA